METRALVSWHWNKSDMNDQFFLKSSHKSGVKRTKLFDMKINSGAIAMTDYGGHFKYEHDDYIKRSLNEKYFKKGDIFQNNYPLGCIFLNMEIKLHQNHRHLHHLRCIIKIL